MANLSMTQAEEKALDSQVEQMMDWAKTRQAEAEQLAMDSARLMACTTDRLDKLKNQGFLKRCWSRFSGQAGAMERANVNDIIQMQKMSFRYVNMLQEQQLLMAHSLLSLKNNLNSLAIREEQTRQMVGLLAERTRERFEKLENRVDQLEISTNLQGWLLGLEERDYDKKYPTEYMRLFRVINDFYRIKNDNWNYNDLMFMRKAIRTVGLDPTWNLPIGVFLNSLTDEVARLENGIDTYRVAITEHAPDNLNNYSQFAIENISSPAFLALHGINTHYADKMDTIEALQDSLSISKMEALKIILTQSIKSMDINMDYEVPLAETAIEILGCLRLVDKLVKVSNEEVTADTQANTSETDKNAENINSSEKNAYEKKKVDLSNLAQGKWQKANFALTFDTASKINYNSIVSLDNKFVFADSRGIWQTSDFETAIQLADYENIQSVYTFDSQLLCRSGNIVRIWRGDTNWERIEWPNNITTNNQNIEKIFFCNDNIVICFSSTHSVLDAAPFGAFLSSLSGQRDSKILILYGNSLDQLEFCNQNPKEFEGSIEMRSNGESIAIISKKGIDDYSTYKEVCAICGAANATGLLPFPCSGRAYLTCVGNAYLCRVKDRIFTLSDNKFHEIQEKDKVFAQNYDLAFKCVVNYPDFGVGISVDENTIYFVDGCPRAEKLGTLSRKPIGVAYNGKLLVVSCESGAVLYKEIS